MAKQVSTKDKTKAAEPWGSTSIKLGFAQIPTVLFHRQRELGLDAIDVNIILQLASYWWYADQLPYPSKKTIAEAMGIHPSTVQRRIRALEHRGYVTRQERFSKNGEGRMTNKYDLTGLVVALTQKAKVALQKREQKKTVKGRRALRSSLVQNSATIPSVAAGA